MAGMKLELLIDAQDMASKKIHQLRDAVVRDSEAMERSLADVGKASAFVDQIFDASKRAIIGLVGLGSAASDVTEAINFVDQVFGDASVTIQKWAETANRSALLSKRGALDAAASLGIFGQRIELTGKGLAQFSTNLVELAADMASLKNTRVEDAVVAIAAAMRNEYEPIRRYGVVLNDLVLKQEALRLGIYDGTGQLTQQQKILAVNSELYKQMGVAIGDVERTFTGFANQSRYLQANLENVSATLGQNLAPTFSRVLQAANGALLVFQGMPPVFQSMLTNTTLLAAATGLLFGGMVKGFTIVQNLRLEYQNLKLALADVAANGNRAQRAILGIGKGAVAVAAIAAITTVAIDAANAFAQVEKRSADAFKTMAKGAQDFDRALTLEGLDKLAKAEGDTARLSNLWEDFGKELKVTAQGASVDIEDMDRAMSKLKDTSATLAYQVLDDLEASIGTTMGVQGVEAANELRENIARWRADIDASVEAQVRLTKAREEDEELLRQQAIKLGLVEGATEELTEEQEKQQEAIAELGQSLQNLNREYELAGGNVEAFESATERLNDSLYAADEAAIEVLDGFADLSEQLKDNGKSLDITTKAGRENRKAVIDLGKSIREDLVQTFKDADGDMDAVTQRMEYWNGVLKMSQSELGLTDQEMREYQQTLGLTPAQVTTLVKLNGQEEARIQIDLLNLDLDSLEDRETVSRIQTLILQGDYIGARAEIQRYYDRNPITLRLKAEGLGQMNAWLQGGSRPTRSGAAAPSGNDGAAGRAAPFSTPGLPAPGSTIDVPVRMPTSRNGVSVVVNMPPGTDEYAVMSAIERYRRRNTN